MDEPLDVAALRRSYSGAGLDVGDLDATWSGQLTRWVGEAVTAGLTEPNAMVLATADSLGRPSARTVLLKGVDERGLVLFTHYTSRKGVEALAAGHAAVVLPMIDLERQVTARGRVEKVSAAETEVYFHSRPHGSQLGAWASPQSEVVASRAVLDDARAALEERYPPGTAVPVPPHWGGLRLVPSEVEFWQGRPDRMHDRLRFRDDGGRWVVERLAP